MSKPRLAEIQSRFVDRLFLAGGSDPGDDALAIAPERLGVYHELVRRNYMSMIRFAYLMSFRLMVNDLKRGGGTDGFPADVKEIIRRYLSAGAAKTHSTREIADTFRTFFDAEFAALHALRPELADLMDVERAKLHAAYHWDDPGRAPTDEELTALAASPIDEFLACEVVRVPTASALRLGHAVGTLYHALRHRRFPEPDDHSPGQEFVLVTRHRVRLEAEVTVVDEATVLAHELAPVGEPIPVERLAGRWIAALPPSLAELDEAGQLAAFGQAVFAGLRTGALTHPA